MPYHIFAFEGHLSFKLLLLGRGQMKQNSEMLLAMWNSSMKFSLQAGY